jgi:lipopolysaccharide transport system permease protein
LLQWGGSGIAPPMDASSHLQPSDHVVLDLSADQSWADWHKAAWRDVRDGLAQWRLVWTLAWLDIRLRYRGSLLGPFWLTISTGAMVLAMGGLYALLFRIEVRDYIPFLALSLVLWNYLGTLVGDSCIAFTTNEGLIRSVRMPFTLYAARIVVRNIVVLAHNALVVLAVFTVLWTWPGATALLALPGLVLWLVTSLALALLLGAVCARLHDIPPIVGSIMQMAFFVSAVIWKPSQLGEHEWMMAFNPFFSLLEIVRGPLMGTVPSPLIVACALGYTTLLLVVTWLVFARVRGRIAFWL